MSSITTFTSRDFTQSAERIRPELRDYLNGQQASFDVHCHIFNHHYLPKNYLGIRLDVNDAKLLSGLIKILQGKKTDDDNMFQHLADFISFAQPETMTLVAQKFFDLFPQQAIIYCPLMMDLKTGYRYPRYQNDFNEQLDEMKTVHDTFPARILPFVALDPNNPDMPSNFKKAFSKDYNFAGVKIYPALGYLPNHPQLMEVFGICEQLQIPVTTHCGGDSVKTPADVFNLPCRNYAPDHTYTDTTVHKEFLLGIEKTEFFNNPLNWEPVLSRFPNLRLNLAHFGGDGEWKKYAEGKDTSWVHDIIYLIQKYDHVYTDISYLLNQAGKENSNFLTAFVELFSSNTKVREHILFGTDYYMVAIENNLISIRTDFENKVSNELMDQLSRKNPMRFLGIS